MLMVLIGPPGGGKGTQSKRLLDHFGFPHLPAGQMLPRSVCDGSLLGENAGLIMDSADLAPNEL